MTSRWQEQVQPGAALRTLVQEATIALIAMDAQRLQELARCCADLNRELQGTGAMAEAAAEIRCAAEDVNLLGRVLFETRANLVVLSRLHAIRLHEQFIPTGEGTRSGLAIDPWPGLGRGMAKGVAYGDN
jgi:hypothetical protein